MTEPEDLEEDLFADLYDADESANHPTYTNATPANVEPAPAAAPHQVTEYAARENVTGIPSFQAHENDYKPAEPNGALQQIVTSGIDVGQGGDATGTPVEPEPRGTGIKEDG